MPDAVGRASAYRELADESLKLSERASDDEIRGHYCAIAASYLAKARAELTRAEQRRIRTRSQG
jgi:hypothetical protein